MADHLFSPDEPPKPIRIAYNGPLYDGGDWNEFPARQGWETEPGTQKFPFGQIPQELHSAIECWLYFGMLHSIFGDALDQSDFLIVPDSEDEAQEKPQQQQQYLTTKQLEKYVGTEKAWKKNGLGARAIETIPKVCEQLRKYNTLYIRPEMCFSIQLAVQALWNVTEKRADGPLKTPPSVQLWLYLREREAEQMVRAGWCPLDAEKCRQIGVQLDTPAYLLQLVRTKAAWNKRTHERCKKTECVADNVDEKYYVTRHVQEGCDCEHMYANVEQLQAILLDGGIPLLQITPCEGDQGFEIAIVKKKSNKRYVGVSHVWADGLGNPFTNSLPTCQVGLLYERARLLLTDKEYVPQYENGPFGPLHTGAARLAHFAGSRRADNSVLLWIDTLCIPLEGETRGLAIQRIRATYDGAYRTMLLDSEIRQVNSAATSNLELCLRVLYCSGWIRRLWTLQEGLAAKSRLYVILADKKAVNISTVADELFTKLNNGKLPLFQEKIARYAAAVWYQYFQSALEYASKFERFVNVVTSPFVPESWNVTEDKLVSWNWYNVATRASSKDGDRPIVLAGVLNLDVKEILSVKGSDERMRKLYSLLDGFPTGVLFLDEPHFEEDGMRWAVKVCRFTDQIRSLTGGAGKITPRGLQVKQYRSWVFSGRTVFDLRLMDDDNMQQVWEQWLTDCQIPLDGPPAEVLHLTTKAPIDFEPDATHGLILKEFELATSSKSGPCVLVSLQETEGDVHYARYTSLERVKALTAGWNLPQEGYLIGGKWEDLQAREWVIG
ncbi:hypothetical protein BJY01DRAFT_94111 [Aspergillus pseudoustus]|uniref:Heterokaryon incompatibility domain-containing protein n=1 Tax=Aspergillus pseudoustus TaxID=1810923 RepID=A0ABR4IZF1_9EURO